ncbi:MAG: GMC family oxidoreductase [Myxococcota bacterium]|nr:GMC family oxidoreductase [Myxococcota bacterium]
METRDLGDAAGDLVVDADVCIVGSGPAGVAVALEVARSGKRVVVLEGGGRAREPETQALYALESVGLPFAQAGAERRVRVFGGSSTAWSGRCATFDPVDFARRPWVPGSGWPFGPDAVSPHLRAAAKLLRLGPLFERDLGHAWPLFGVPRPRPELDPATLRTQLWQWSHSPDGGYVNAARELWPRLETARKLTVYLHANATSLLTSESGRAVGVRASSLGGRKLWVRAPRVVLACGAIENARLLLASRERRPEGLGNTHGLVGRYLLDHPSPVLGTWPVEVAPRLLDRFGHYWLDDHRGRHVYAAGVALSERMQVRRRLPNAAAYLLAEPREDAGWLSLRRLTRGGGGTLDRAWDALNVLRRPGEIVRAAMRRARHRPEQLPLRRLALVCNPEQIPSADSRVTLSEQVDALGVPTVRVDWRADARERDAALAMLEVLDRELPRLGLPRPTPSPWTRGEGDWREAFVDHAHPMGTTRMATDPRHGVVDPDGEVFDAPGVFVAGGSVFPTGGTAHPTLMIMALSTRLGAHLRAALEAERPASVVSEALVARSA